MNSTRKKIMKTLLTCPGSTIKELSEAVGINGISIRHHLSTLEAEELIFATEERHGVGRPRLIYSLTDKGAEQFPTNYLRLTNRILAKLERMLSKEELAGFLEEIGKEIAKDYQIESSDLSFEERLAALQEILAEEGFITEWENNNGAYQVTSFSCPYYQLGLHHPELCHLNQALITAYVGQSVEIISCIFQGEDQCIYEIQTSSGKP